MLAATKVYSVFSEALAISLAQVGDNTSPENTPEWDSLKAMDLVVALEAAFNVRFSTKEIISMRTVGIVRKILAKKGVQGAWDGEGTGASLITHRAMQRPPAYPLPPPTAKKRIVDSFTSSRPRSSTCR